MSFIEEWKPIKGREDYYEVSNTGKVRSLINRVKSKGIFELKQYVNSKKYCSLDLALPELTKCSVHRLVAEAFCTKPEGCNIVNHLDNNPSNNNYDNLEWTTYSGNLIHAQKQGRLTESQSKGGITTAKKATDKLFSDTNSLIDKVFGSFTVMEVAETKTYGKVNRPKLLCKCTCGNTQVVDKIQLEKGLSTKCKKCVANNKAQTEITKVIDFYKDTQLGIWKFTGNSNNCTDMRSKQLKLEATCDCGHTQLISYPSIKTSLLKCKNCNKHNDIV